VLFAFFVLIVLVIPGYFYYYFTKEKTEIGGVSPKNRDIFKTLINENMKGKVIAGIIG
jgi:hypothetical protein